MATYYRWRQGEIQYLASTPKSNGRLDGGRFEGTSIQSISFTVYYSTQIQVSSDGKFSLSGEIKSISANYLSSGLLSSLRIPDDSEYYFALQQDDLDSSDASTTTQKNMCAYGKSSAVTLQIVQYQSPARLIVSFMGVSSDPFVRGVKIKPSFGTLVGYVYSTSSSAYPNGGVSGSYYYDQRTTIGDINITVSSLAMVGQSIPLSWSSISVSGSTVTYQLQRNVNNGSWENVGSPTSSTLYTDTAQTGWTQVQYQVAPIIDGTILPYTQSSIIPVSDPSVLVISGQDGNLGTLTSNIPYTVSSNTGNPISLTRTVNGAQVATITINSGFAYNIPITDLPNGANTVSISAQVQTSIGQQSQTRTWTYYKEPINIPDTGGVAQLVQNGTNIWPISLAECIKVPTYFGNTLDKALELLAPAVNTTIIAAGTYTGTGQYGSSTPNILNFSTQPLLVLVYGPNISLSISTTNNSSPAYISGTQARWYSTVSAEEQLNSSGVEYSYIAIVKTS